MLLQKITMAPSLMCMDITDTLRQLSIFDDNCGFLHIDIMDGHFVPNLALSMDFVKRIRPHTTSVLDVHLMVTDPQNYLDELAFAGADIISVHAETIQSNAFRVLNRIHELNCRAGIAICPATPLSAISAYLSLVDTVTVMTVDPGFAGQMFVPQMIEKIKGLRALREETGCSFRIEVDGAIGPKQYKNLYDAGAEIYVLGTSGLFRKGYTLEENCRIMKDEFFTATGEKV